METVLTETDELGSMQDDVKIQNDTPLPESSSEPQFIIPEKYKDKAYLKGIDNIEKVYDMLDNAQSLIGKRSVGIPKEGATQEEWNNFYKAMGRPESHDEYAFEDAELPEEYKVDEEFLAESKKTMHELGLSNKQAAGLKKWFDQYGIKSMEQQMQAQEASDKEFNELASKHFGAEKDKAISNARALLTNNVPEGFKERIGQMSNDDLIMFAGVLNNIQKKYINEDSLANQNGAGSLANGRSEMQAKARELMSNPAFRDIRHPDHSRIKREVEAIYANLPDE